MHPPELPARLTRFVGREQELTELRRLLRQWRLLTLTGAGGVGKTRLGLELADAVEHDYADGVRLVQVASLAEPQLLPQVVAVAAGVREPADGSLLEHLSRVLHDRRLLLVLDNCEHLLDACAELAQTLLASCPRLTILATSRERLGLTGETTWRVPSLTFPWPQRAPAVDRLDEYEAVRLFFDRAVEARPGFAIASASEAAALISICYQLDGIPLALELAAARVRVLTLEEIASRLDDRFRLLVGGRQAGLARHQTLRASVEWSHELLADGERTLLRRLSVFAGGWTLDAAESLVGEDVLEPLSSLVEKSLVQTHQHSGCTRYSFLDTIRHYATERLAETGEAETVRQRHAEYFMRLAEQARHALEGSGQRRWLERLDAERYNLRAAADWFDAADDRAELGLRLASGLGDYWAHRGYLSEGTARLESALERDGPPSLARAWALGGLSALRIQRGDMSAGAALSAESAAMFASLGDRAGQSSALSNQAIALAMSGEPVRAVELLRASRALAQQAADRWAEAYALRCLGWAARLLGDLELGRESLTEALLLFDAAGDQLGRALSLNVMAGISLDAGRAAEAVSLLRQALAVFADLEDMWGMLLVFWHLVAAYAQQGAFASAARLLGAVQALRERMGAEPLIRALAGQDTGTTLARAHLGELAFEKAVAAGRALPLSQAIAEALHPPEFVPEAPVQIQRHGKLTARERQIAALIAEGLTNRQIAERVIIAERTADTHVQNILAKLGCARRTEVAALLAAET